MAVIRGTLPFTNNMQANPQRKPSKNHYLNHDYLAGKIADHPVVMSDHRALGDCMCCGREPADTLWQIVIQTQPDHEWFQIGIPRCTQILTAALRVRERATSDPNLEQALALAGQKLGDDPRPDEIRLMGELLRSQLTMQVEIAKLDAYLATV